MRPWFNFARKVVESIKECLAQSESKRVSYRERTFRVRLDWPIRPSLYRFFIWFFNNLKSWLLHILLSNMLVHLGFDFDIRTEKVGKSFGDFGARCQLLSIQLSQVTPIHYFTNFGFSFTPKPNKSHMFSWEKSH